MNHRLTSLCLSLALTATPALADTLGSADAILCTPILATRCYPDGECVSGPPWNWNIPEFIKVDLDKKRLTTTEASGEDRSTKIASLIRENGQIFLQGVEQGRAFSVVIAEDSGRASIAVALHGTAVAVFGACTPLPLKR